MFALFGFRPLHNQIVNAKTPCPQLPDKHGLRMNQAYTKTCPVPVCLNDTNHFRLYLMNGQLLSIKFPHGRQQCVKIGAVVKSDVDTAATVVP